MAERPDGGIWYDLGILYSVVIRTRAWKNGGLPQIWYSFDELRICMVSKTENSSPHPDTSRTNTTSVRIVLLNHDWYYTHCLETLLYYMCIYGKSDTKKTA